MHICHVITRLIIGGAQENTLLTCRGLVERGHRVTLIAGTETGAEGSLWEQADAIGCEAIRAVRLKRSIHPLEERRARAELERLFRRLAPDVVHTHSSKAGILGRSAAARANVPIIVHTIHGMSFNRTQGAFARVIYRFLERRAAKRTTALVTVADAMIDQAVAAGIGKRDQFITIRSGMRTERFKPDPALRARFRREWGVAEDEVVVGTIARLFHNKGYDEILAAMPLAVRRMPNLRFVWIGDGGQRREYERSLQREGLRDRVHFTGLLGPEAVAERINGFDLLVHASRWEGLPRAVVQALLTEVPPVCFDNDGAPEVVVPGETGILAPLGDVGALADGIVTLAGDPRRRAAFGREGRNRCLARFDWRRMVDELDSLYERLREKANARLR